MLNLKKLNKKAALHDLELVKGQGYFYWVNLTQKSLEMRGGYAPESVYICHWNHVSEGRWMRELETAVRSLPENQNPPGRKGRSLVGQEFNVRLTGKKITKMQCTRWTDDIRVFKCPVDELPQTRQVGGRHVFNIAQLLKAGELEMDYIEYGDAELLGGISLVEQNDPANPARPSGEEEYYASDEFLATEAGY